jgi:Iron-containing redox enzyme
LSTAVIETLSASPPAGGLSTEGVTTADPFGADLAIALHTCYELHYRGLAGVDDEWEWDPELLRFRAALERHFLAGLRSEVAGGHDVDSVIDSLLVERVPAEGLSQYLREEAEWWQLREYLVLRSIYHLKEADPQAWMIPRLQGREKAALVAVEFDEYGGGNPDRLHARLFAEMMTEVGLSRDYLGYLDDVPSPAIAIVNLMSLFGLHRRWRGASVGQFAFVEITSSPGAQRMVQALQRLGARPQVTHFYAEHVEADAVHEQLMRREVVGGLLEREPDLAADVVFGIQALDVLEGQLASQVLASWRAGDSSLLRRLPDHAGAS